MPTYGHSLGLASMPLSCRRSVFRLSNVSAFPFETSRLNAWTGVGIWI